MSSVRLLLSAVALGSLATTGYEIRSAGRDQPNFEVRVHGQSREAALR